MRFTKIIGKIEENDHEAKEAIRLCEEKLSTAMTELSLSYERRGEMSTIGGDPFIFQLIYPMTHICDLTHFYMNRIEKRIKNAKEKREKGEVLDESEEDLSKEAKAFRASMRGRILTTAATNGKICYYSPEFINKLSRTGIRFVLHHEALHGALNHPERHAGRFPRLWNIAIDFKVNYLILADLQARKIDQWEKLFKDNLGDYVVLEEYAQFLRDPFNPPPKLAHWNPMHSMRKQFDPGYADPADANNPSLFFAEPSLEGDMRKPEYIYDYLLSCIPKCDKCGKVGKYKKPKEYKELEKKIEEQQKKEKEKSSKSKDKSNQGNKPSDEKSDEKSESSSPGENEGDQQGSCCGHNHGKDEHSHEEDGQEQCDCDKEGSDSEYFDGTELGDLVDEHIDADVSQEEYAKKMYEAAENARRMGGKVPGELEEEIGQLIGPKVHFKDFVASRLHRMRQGGGRADWNRPRIKPLFMGVYSPRKKDFFVSFGVLVDSSGSMDVQEDMTFGISQLQSLGDRGTGWIASFDTQFYPESVVKLRNCKPEELLKSKIVGRGGTMITHALENYEKHAGKADLLVVITDGGVVETNEEINAKLPPKTEVVWLLTRPNPAFKPNGRIFTLRD